MTIEVVSEGSEYISTGDLWRFSRGSQAPQAGWMAADYNDSDWDMGPSGFGYGDNDDATTLEDMRGRYVSVYIRKAFTVSTLSSEATLILDIDYDDGFVAYLNGVEVARRSMPQGEPTFETTASSHEAGESERIILGTAGQWLKEGHNVLAIEGHNVSLNSSDFSLIPSLYSESGIVRLDHRWISDEDTVELEGWSTLHDLASVRLGDRLIPVENDTWTAYVTLEAGLNEFRVEGLDTEGHVVDVHTIELIYVAPDRVVTGTLEGHTVWSGACAVQGTVYVPGDVNLVVDPGTWVLMEQGAELVVSGRMLAQGNEPNSIRFTHYGEGTAWKQIRFVNARDSLFSNCLFEYADSAGAHQDYYEPGPREYHEAVVVLAGHVDFEHCVFRNLPDNSGRGEGDAIAVISDDPNTPGTASANVRFCQFLGIGQGVHTRYAYVLVEECYFTGKHGDNDDVDLYGESDPPPLILNNRFIDPEHDDMINPTRCSALIIGNVIAGSDDHGVVLRDTSYPVMINNLIYDCQSAGIAIENTCEALLINNTIYDCGRGIRLLDLGRWGPPYRLQPGGGIATVIDCTIEDCPQPITLADSDNTSIEDRGSHVTIINSDIEGGRDGVINNGVYSTVTWFP